MIKDTYFVKSNDWAKEKEYRLISQSNKNFAKIPLQNIGKITGIYFGCRFFENLSNRQEYLIDIEKDPSIKLYSMKLNLNKLKLGVELL